MSLRSALIGDCGYGALGADDPTYRPTDIMQRGAGYTDAGTVKTVQQVLIAKGYDVGPTGADGIWGPNTQSGLEMYNRDRGTPKLGPPDDEVLSSLGLTHSGATKIVSIDEGSTITASRPKSSAGLIALLAAGAGLAAFKKKRR